MSYVSQYYSPLRYPGGKASLADFLIRTLEHNNINYGVYVEGFAGGAGAALKLLMQEYVGDIYLNDKDAFVSSFWESVKNNTDELCKLINDVDASFSEWTYRRKIILDKGICNDLTTLEKGFTGFFLNRVNRSGILKGGPIGGVGQEGPWKMDARYNKKELINRIQLIALYGERIHVSNDDVIDFLKKFELLGYNHSDVLLYLDPPYVGQGKALYQHYFKEKNHKDLAKFLQKESKYNWIISYDDHPLIHESYKEVTKNIFEFNYFASRTKIGRELVISSKQFLLPDTYMHYSRVKQLEEANYHAEAI